ncbi:type I secretion C-terminal target domain-containing protein, partial [Porticoccaceae bacterium]|nr:type I secretion C-terminal target domain-containing protein [Porticoccaceae bacterium]
MAEITTNYYTIVYDTTVLEDGYIDISLYFGLAFSSDVTVSFSSAENVFFDGASASGSLTFTPDELGSSHTKSVRVSVTDDISILYNQLASISVSFSSDDGGINSLQSESLSIAINDNDFQRSIDQTKLPSAGDNKIIYDLDLSANAGWYTSNVRWSKSALQSDVYDYRLGVGSDDIEVSSGVQTSIDNKNIVFFGEGGDDRIAFVNLADGGIGNDELIASTVVRNGDEISYSYYVNRGVIGEHRSYNVLFGGDGDDVITGSVFSDFLIGGLDSDTLTGDAGDDTLHGDGFSTIEWDNFTTQSPAQYGSRLNSDYNRAVGGADTITAGDGNDYVDGGGANDSIDAGEGNNTVYGGLGADTIAAGAGADNIYGGDGTSDPGVDGADEIHAGGGSDTVFGEGGDDVIYAEVGDDTVQGGDGDDSIYGAEGADTLYGNAGDDTISGGIDDDTLRGGIGADTLSGDSGSDTLYGDDQDDSLDGGDGDDVLYGGSGADTLIGGLGADTIDGGADTDTISGGGGSDIITAGSGDDVIDGGDGDDTITAGIGADTITGGAGADTFVFTYDDFLDDQVDVIKDFTVGSGGDVLDLSALHSASLAAGFGDSWSGTTWAYSHGYIQFAIEGEDTLVNYDQDGWYDSHSTTTIARLEGVNLASLSVVNAEPDPSDALYQIESASALSEDSNALVTYRVVLGKAPTADVVVSVTGGDQIYVNDSSSAAALTFTANNWYIPQVVRLTAIDDLSIERDHDASLTHSFSSSDTEFDGLTAVKSVSITDNDFQRSIDQTKLPSAGDNKIIYDLDLSANAGWYTSNVRWSKSALQSDVYDYRLGVGSDDIEVSSGVQTSIDNKNIVFFGEGGDDRIAFVNLADGGIGNDELIASTVVRNGDEISYSYYVNRGVIGEHRSYNVLFGGDGDDVITGSVFSDFLIGGLDSDTLTGDAGDDTLHGDGFSTIEWDNFTTQSPAQYGSRLNSDYNRAVGGADTITAGDGNDYVDGGGANDSIDAGEGNNTVYGGLGADTIAAGAGADNIYGGDGTSDPGVDGADEIHAGGGSDTVFGEGGDDVIYAEVGDDTVQGGDGDDSIYGAEGADTLYGNAGDDTISGGIDDDTLRGGIGADTLSGDSGSDTLYGDDQDDSLDGGDGDDVLYGGSGADTLIGGLGADTIDGGADTDTISGGGGSDIITAGSGDDVIDGGDGDDTITAGVGADTITGGAGADTFVFTYGDFLDDQVDVIKDFTVGSGGDVLDLSALHSASLAANGVNSGQHNYPYSLGFIRFIQSGDDTVVAYDTDGPDLANEGRSFAILKDVSPLNLTEDNLSVAGTNFGIARTGIISAVTETASEVQVTLRLWGGQPSADV